MNAPKVTVQGVLVIAVAGVIGYFLWKAYSTGQSVVNAVSNFDNDLAGALVPDANAQVQQLTGQVMADLKAAGYPPVGSPQYNAIVTADGDPQAVVNLTTGSGG